MRLTCKVGEIILDDETPMSKAKLIRDTVCGQILNPTDGRKIRTPAQALQYAKECFDADKHLILGVTLYRELL